jgi:hypothetical protein
MQTRDSHLVGGAAVATEGAADFLYRANAGMRHGPHGAPLHLHPCALALSTPPPPRSPRTSGAAASEAAG